jgi:hypothetical protein
LVNTKYLNLNLNLVSSMMFPINLVFQWCLIFDTKLKKTSLPVIWTEILTENPGRSVSTNTNTTNWFWFLVDPVDDEDWRDRPRTDPSSISDLGTVLGFRPQTNWFQLDFRVKTPCVQLLDILSSINWSRLLSLYWVSYRASYLDLFTQQEPK